MPGTTGVLYGTDASCSGTTPGLFNAFTVTVTQGITQAAGFGDGWIRTRGTIGSITGSMSGFVASNNSTNMSASIVNMGGQNRTGSIVTFTFSTSGDSISFAGVQTGVGFDVQYLGNQTLSVGFTGDGSPTVVWTAF